MSYEITSWKTRKLENLAIPYPAFFLSTRKDWHPDEPEIINAETNEVSMKCGCEQEIKGRLKDGILHITELDLSGEGSGSFMYYVMNDALKRSAGILEARLVWEGGDSVTNLSVKDGVVEQMEIER